MGALVSSDFFKPKIFTKVYKGFHLGLRHIV